MALLTVIATASSATTSLALAVFYKFWKIKKLMEEHERERKAGMRMVYRSTLQ
jgi:hypothetical protein